MADTEVPLYDVEAAYREIAVNACRGDVLTTKTAEIADGLAAQLARHFAPEELPVAARAIVITAASLIALDGLPLAVVCNVAGFAGYRLELWGRHPESHNEPKEAGDG